jgi:broad specificity phosphatase PhoE
MSLEILIVRHGQSEGNRDRVFTGHGPSPLTELGRRQAEAAARAVAARPIDAIYASDLPRALQTAAPLALLTGLSVTADPALRERNFGDYTGLAFADIEARWPDDWRRIVARDPTFQPPGGESNIACRARVGRFLVEMLAARDAGRVVLVSHGVAINQMLYHLLELDPERVPPVVFQVENCSVQRVEKREGGGVRIACVNDVAHLAGLIP